MKHTYTFIGVILIAICQYNTIKAQAPQLMNYQAVVRNTQGQPVAGTLVNFQFQIHDGTATGTSVFTETDTATTNQFGLATAQIGTDSSLAVVVWSSGNKFLQVSVDVAGGTNFVDMGTTQLLSVPYALNAGSAASAWSLTGNTATVDSLNFIGTTDINPLNFKVWGWPAGRIEPPGLLYTTSFGYQGLETNVSGTYNSAFGYRALSSNETGGNNTAMGLFALASNVSGSYNTAMGVNALQGSAGDNNTAIGTAALSSLSVGFQNTAVGVSALGAGNGDFNTAVGMNALKNTNGNGNTAIGINAAQSNTGGNENTALGNGTLYNNATGSYNIAIGYAAGTTDNFDHTISIGNDTYLNGASNQAFIGGTGTVWNGGNVTWSTYSDARVKRDIQDDVKGLDFITRLRPVTYYRNYRAMLDITGNKDTKDYPEKYDIEKIKFSGFLAQDVEKAAKEAGYNFSGITAPKNDKDLYTLSYEQFVVPLVKGMQEQQQLIANQQQQIDALLKRLDALERSK